MRTSRAVAAALGVSLLLHAALLLVLALRPRAPLPAPPAPAPVEVDIRWLDVAPGPPPAPPSAPVPAPRRRSPRPAPSALPAPPAREPPPPPVVEAPPPPSPALPAEPRRPAVSLVPRSDFTVPVAPGLAEGAAPEARSGQTRRLDDAPEDVARRQARDGAEARERVTESLLDAQASQRVSGGRIHPYFGELRDALHARLKDVPAGLPFPKLTEGFAERYFEQLQRFGRGGSPEEDAALGFEREMQVIAQGNAPVALSREAGRDPGLGMPGAQGPRAGKKQLAPPDKVLRVVVELRQTPEGAFAGVTLLQSSGKPLLDRHVLDNAPLALRELPAPPPGTARALRTHWAFEAHLSYARKVRDFKLPEDLPYLTATLAAGGFGGSFDLTALQDFEVMDLRNPRWVLRSELLKVF